MPSPSKKNILHFKTWKFYTFCYIYALPDPDPDPLTQFNPDPDPQPVGVLYIEHNMLHTRAVEE
jgi:hypothetical protein